MTTATPSRDLVIQMTQEAFRKIIGLWSNGCQLKITVFNCISKISAKGIYVENALLWISVNLFWW